MKVFENIENYDPFPSFDVSSARCDELISELKRVITDLIPLRTNRRKTREYCEKYLRIDLHEDQFKNPMKYGLPDVGSGSEYTPIPGEVKFNERLFQSALLHVIYDDRISFGYLWDLLNYYLDEREGVKNFGFDEFSDVLINFFINFDIDEIRKESEKYTDLNDRALYLNKKYTDYKIVESSFETEDLLKAKPVGSALKALVDEVDKAIRITGKGVNQNRGTGSRRNSNSSSTDSPASSIDIRHHVLYDLTLCSDVRYASLRTEVHGGCLTHAGANVMAFSSMVNDAFEKCYHFESDFSENKEIFQVFPDFMIALMESYRKHVASEYKDKPRKALRLMYEWVFKTRNLVENAYVAHKTYESEDPMVDEDGDTYFAKVDTYTFKRALLMPIYQYFTLCTEDFCEGTPPEVEDIMPFNMWGDRFEDLTLAYRGQFGLDFKKRAVVVRHDNMQLYSKSLADSCIRYCNRVTSPFPSGGNGDITEDVSANITDLLHSSFRDYLNRVKKVVADASIIDSALLDWILTLEHVVYDSYTDKAEIIKEKLGYHYLNDQLIANFYVDMCLKNVFEIAVEYFKDYDRIPLVSPSETTSTDPVIATAPEEKKPAEEAPANPEPKCLHTRTIDYKTLYDAWNNIAFTRTSLEEFTAAIDNADFSGMMEKATNAGVREGYIVSVKFIIKRLAQFLGNNWFDIACGSIDQTMNAINKINDGTKRISKINTKILSDCIK
ncbi:MAG: hypothetical protein IJS91_01115 [Bacteroidales bacterium]|nr:hypothetical protein [Bacteroidales bacterium]